MNLKPVLIITVLSMLIACKEQSRKLYVVNIPSTYDSISTDLKAEIPDYDSFRLSVAGERKKVKKESIVSIRKFLYTLIRKDIFNYWKGTKWDYNGTTREPGIGNIACGYFVTNTLTDLGFKLNRIKLAQSVSSKMIKALCVNIKYFTNLSDLHNYLASEPDNSVYIIGLDFHTGYILKDSSGAYFLHSNYINRTGVVMEKVSTSANLRNNKNFMIGSLTQNKQLLHEWAGYR